MRSPFGELRACGKAADSKAAAPPFAVQIENLESQIEN
jgi:hypothetical protein